MALSGPLKNSFIQEHFKQPWCKCSFGNAVTFPSYCFHCFAIKLMLFPKQQLLVYILSKAAPLNIGVFILKASDCSIHEGMNSAIK